MFNPLQKTFESDNEGPNKKSIFINESKEKEKSLYIGNKTKVNKFKVPKNFGKKKFKYTIDEESDTNMILEQEYNINKEKSVNNTINLKLLSDDSIIWKKSGIFLLEIKIKRIKNEINEGKSDKSDESDDIKNDNDNKTLEYLHRLSHGSKDYRKKVEIYDEKDIKENIINYIKQYKYKIKLLIIYLEKEEEDDEYIEEENNNKINELATIKEEEKDINESGFKNTIFIDIFSSQELNIPFYIITKEYLYAKLFNKKMNYIFMNNDFLSDKIVKVLLFHDKKISPTNSNNDLVNNINNNSNKNEPIIITTRGFLPEFKETKINIEGSTSSTLSLSSDEDYLDNSVIYTRNGIGILQFKIKICK